MKHNEHDAACQLCDTAELKMLGTVDDRDPLEETQRMPVADRRYRQTEARRQCVDGHLTDNGYTSYTEMTKRLPVVENRTWPTPGDPTPRVTGLNTDPTSPTGQALLASAGMRELPPGYTILRSPDFRDFGRASMHPLDRAQQDGFPGDES